MRTAITLICFLICSSTASAVELRDEGPKGKKWLKITDIHYMDKSSIKKIKGKMYQASICNYASNSRVGVWAYSKVRVDCATKQAWTYSADQWIGPMSPTNFDEGVMKYVCK